MARNVVLVSVLVGLGVIIGLSCGRDGESPVVPEADAVDGPIPEPGRAEAKDDPGPAAAEPEPTPRPEPELVPEPEPVSRPEAPPRQDPAVHDKSGSPPEKAVSPKSGNLRIGVVNLKECFKAEKYAYVKVVDAQLREVMDHLAKEVEKLKKEYDETKQRMDGLPQDSKLRLELRGRLKILEAELKWAEEKGKINYVNLYREKKTEVFNKIVEVAAVVGKDRGFDLILRVEEPQLEENELLRETVTQQIYRRSILYNAPGIDITDEVIKKLNEIYELEKAKDPKKNGEQKVYFCPSCEKEGRKQEYTEKEAADRNPPMTCARCGKKLSKRE